MQLKKIKTIFITAISFKTKFKRDFFSKNAINPVGVIVFFMQFFLMQFAKNVYYEKH